MKKFGWTFLFLIFWCLSAQAKIPEGAFQVKGFAPGQNTPYQGMVQVIKSEETYTVVWKLGKDTFIGTAIDHGDTFAVMFMTPDKSWGGIAIFAKNGAQWKGKWAPIGGKKVGTEEWTPVQN